MYYARHLKIERDIIRFSLLALSMTKDLFTYCHLHWSLLMEVISRNNCLGFKYYEEHFSLLIIPCKHVYSRFLICCNACKVLCCPKHSGFKQNLNHCTNVSDWLIDQVLSAFTRMIFYMYGTLTLIGGISS